MTTSIGFLRLRACGLLLFLAVFSSIALADTVSGAVKDPSGAVVPKAQVEISGGELEQTITISTDGSGNFTSPDLKPGTYSIRVLRDGFEPLVQSVNVVGDVKLELSLEIAKREESIAVTGKSAAFANTDPIYRQLRGLGMGETFRFDHASVTVDVGEFKFEQGTLTFFGPINGVVTGAIFIGEGHFHLKPLLVLDGKELLRRTGANEVNEDFSAIVFRFTGDQEAQFRSSVGAKSEASPEVANVLTHWRETMRQRHDVPMGFSEAMLHDETMDNVDADILAAIYNDKHPWFFNAYIHGKKHKDLRFFVRSRVGAIPQLDSSEEVGLINYDPMSLEDGIWYLAHLKQEFLNHTASSTQDRRLFATTHYKIETVIGKNKHLYSVALISFAPLVPGERVLKFGLLPNLRVTRVADEGGNELYFIQESRKADGSFYVILPQAPTKEQTIRVEYAGDQVLHEAGEGSFYVEARSAWYPNLNGFGEKVTYDLTFKVPKEYSVISVGDLQGESTEQGFKVSHWVTKVPVAVAGFNYGAYTKMEMPDSITHYNITGYYLEQLPSNLRYRSAMQSMAPKAMTKYVLDQTRAQMQICTNYFGKIPYDGIQITEQPNFSFGQSWPMLVYLPISAYTDSTQRYMLFGQINNKFTGFVQEVTPHEVAHQWWGHAVGWASYHDQWLSEGFAEFSAGLFLQRATGGDWRKDYIEFWDRLQKRIVEKNNWGFSANDAGPIWMGLRLIAPKTPMAYQNVTYPKGAFVLSMLRSIMYTNEDGDKAFIETMHDFVETHKDHPASTESFIAVVNKHVTKNIDLAGNGRLDWFFSEWVYGTQIPHYQLDYQIQPGENGKSKIHMTITQSEVDEHFGMFVPVYADFGKGMVRVTQVAMAGNNTRNVDLIVPMAPKKVVLNYYKDVLER